MATTSVTRLNWRGRTETSAFVLLAVGAAGTVATAVTAWAVANSPILVNRSGDAIWRSLFVAVYVAFGAYIWWRRPESRLGPIVAGGGFMYAVMSLNASGAPLAYTLGMVAWVVMVLYFMYMYLCVPRGWLESLFDRRFLLAFVLSTAVVWGLILAVSPTLPVGSDFTNCGTNCPHNALQIVSGHAQLSTALLTASDIVLTLGTIGVAMLVFSKARSSDSSTPARIDPAGRRRARHRRRVCGLAVRSPRFPGDEGRAEDRQRCHWRWRSRSRSSSARFAGICSPR